ncbi:uncharacterized protein LOC118465476 isoform X1 [Anopheles albimanus]|uniref:uncharacterized protein LOC118465476 isoform X1 n=1 Tax=Anopheles albimanus TaxID=7167 RepID=UPI0016414A09|nr:uncharacterized protein LOC118465476 isoform X1 [Anopheles albimanus]XP_035789668.1 uncharacterized protein LOC118465476 isoform X1 [Anopheles albimanus]XP_035789669.1 uncharacterized protein LOC118465476 isoform X1 [Anopheles albimanus]
MRILNVRFMEYLIAKYDDLFYKKSIPNYQLGASDDFDTVTSENISILYKFIAGDSVLMIDIILEHIERRLKTRQNRAKAKKLKKKILNQIINQAIKNKSIFILKYLSKSKSSLLQGSLLPYCIAISVRQNCKVEFIWFVQLYCNIFQIEVLDAITIDCDDGNGPDDGDCNFHDFDAIISTIRTNSTSDMPSIILSLLVLTMIYGRKPMAQCLIKLFKITINYSTICDLITFFCKIKDGDVKSKYYQTTSKAVFRYLLEKSDNLSSEQVQSLFFKCTSLKLYHQSECLVDLQAFDMQAIDPISGSSAFHQCVSQEVITWLGKVPDEQSFQLFRKMMNISPVDCFRLCDRDDRSVVHLAMLNGYFDIVQLIVAKWLNIPSVTVQSLKKLDKDDFINLRHCYNQIKTIADSLEGHKSRIFKGLLDDLSSRL